VIVVKFGGTSVGDAEAIERAAAIVEGRLEKRPVVVVSALGGATNALLAVGEQAVLTVMSKREAKLGMIIYYMRRAAKQLSTFF